MDLSVDDHLQNMEIRKYLEGEGQSLETQFQKAKIRKI